MDSISSATPGRPLKRQMTSSKSVLATKSPLPLLSNASSFSAAKNGGVTTFTCLPSTVRDAADSRAASNHLDSQPSTSSRTGSTSTTNPSTFHLHMGAPSLRRKACRGVWRLLRKCRSCHHLPKSFPRKLALPQATAAQHVDKRQAIVQPAIGGGRRRNGPVQRLDFAANRSASF